MCFIKNGTSAGKQVRIFSADVRDFESVEKAVSEIGRVDVLICSHGISIPKAFVDCSVKEMNEMLDINLRGNLNVVKAILPSMKSRSDSSFASIAIVSSQAGQVTSSSARKLHLMRYWFSLFEVKVNHLFFLSKLSA